MLFKWSKKELSFRHAESLSLKRKNEYYRELVDFEQVIGIYIHPATGERTPTSWGVIHYFAGNSYYVIPARPQSIDDKELDLRYLLLAAQRGVSGNAPASLRMITVIKRDHEFAMNFYFQGRLKLKDLNEVACIGSETIASFPVDHGIAEHFVRLDEPATIIPQDESWGIVYQRKERGAISAAANT